MPIFDMHAHVDVCEPLNWYDTAEKLVKLLDEAGIEGAVVSAYRNLPGPAPDCFDELLAQTEHFAGRIYPFIRMDPWFDREAIALLERYAKHPRLYGVKLHPAHYTLHPYGQLTVDLARRAGELGLPVLLHCGDEMMCLPLQIGEMARQCPDTTVILAHMGGFAHLRDTISVAKRCPNVYIDTSEVPLVRSVRETVNAIGAERVLFGTDAPYCDPMVELEKVRLAGLSEEELELICYRNGRRILGLEKGGKQA